MQRELSALASKYKLWGCVLIQFDSVNVGVRSWGINDMACDAMTALGGRILSEIDEGKHDICAAIPEGRA